MSPSWLDSAEIEDMHGRHGQHGKWALFIYTIDTIAIDFIGIIDIAEKLSTQRPLCLVQAKLHLMFTQA